MPAYLRHLPGFGALTDLPCIELSFQGAHVVISPYGAHVLHYQPADSAPLLWLSPLATWHNQTPIRGGVPLCWPWFGPCQLQDLIAAEPSLALDQQQGLSNHGLVRTRMWRLTNSFSTEQQVVAEFAITVSDIPWSQEPVDLVYRVALSAEALTLTLSCDRALPQQAALHSYFEVGHCEQSRVEGLPLVYHDKPTQSRVTTTTSTAGFVGETDRIYPDTPTHLTLLGAHSGNDSILITQQGHDASILWNPGAVKAATAPDIPTEQFHQFVCVESAKLNWRAAPLKLVQVICAKKEVLP